MAESESTGAQEALAELQSGETDLNHDRREQAAESLVIAESAFRQQGDYAHAASSRAALAEVQRRNGALDQAARSYGSAIDLYKQADVETGEASATLALGHI